MSRRNRPDQLTHRDALALLTTVPFKWARFEKIDYDSVPAAFLSGVKFSIMDNTSDSDNVSYMIYACLDDGTIFEADRIIAHGAISAGGGSTYLKINRSIWHSRDDDTGGPVTFWLECSDNVDSTTVVSTAYTHRLKPHYF